MKTKSPMKKKSDKPNTSHWTVAKYLDEVYVPDRQLKINMATKTIRNYRNTVAMFERHVGHPIKLREVTDLMLENFKKWSLDQGCRISVAMDRVYAIKALLRHWRPEDYPKRFGPNIDQSPHWLNVDCEDSLEKVFQENYLPTRTKITSDNTVAHYGRAFKLFGHFLGGVPTLNDLSDHNVGTFLRWLVAEGKVKAVTANGYCKQILAIWNWAAKVRLVDKFPTVEDLPEPEVIPQAWSLDQMRAIIATCHTLAYKIEGIPAGDYWIAFHFLLWDTGERKNAVLSLTWDMFNLKEGTLIVPAEIRKGRQKAMAYRLKPETIEALKKIKEPERELAFPIRNREDTFYRYYRKLIQSAGLPYVRYKSGPQKMRRSFASYVKAAGGDATRALRHSTTRVTDESYLDPPIADPISPNELLPSLAKTASRAPAGRED